MTADYLNSSEEVLDSLDGLFEPQEGITLCPKSMQATSYHLEISAPSLEPAGETQVTIRVVDQNGANINGKPASCLLHVQTDLNNEGDVLVAGDFENDTHRTQDLDQIPIRNISGIIAPYEDAICQLAANKLGRRVCRQVRTWQNVDSRFVQNYMQRGYTHQRGNAQNRALVLTKYFD